MKSIRDLIDTHEPEVFLGIRCVALIGVVALVMWVGWKFGACSSHSSEVDGHSSLIASQTSNGVKLQQDFAPTKSGPELQAIEQGNPTLRGGFSEELSHLNGPISLLHSLEAEVLKDCPDLITWQKRARDHKPPPGGAEVNTYLAEHKDKLPILQHIREIMRARGLQRAVADPSNKMLVQYLFDKTAFTDDCGNVFGVIDRQVGFQSSLVPAHTPQSEVTWHEAMRAREVLYESYLVEMVTAHQIPLGVINAIESSEMANSEHFLLTYATESAIPPEVRKLAKSIHLQAKATAERLPAHQRRTFMELYDRELVKDPSKYIHINF